MSIMSEYIDKIARKISRSGLFIVIVNREYLDSINNRDRNILTHIEVARRLKKPFFVVIDSRLKCSEIMQANIYFSNDNVVKKIMVDMGNVGFMIPLSLEIVKVIKELQPDDNDDVKIITEYQIEECDEKDGDHNRKGEGEQYGKS